MVVAKDEIICIFVPVWTGERRLWWDPGLPRSNSFNYLQGPEIIDNLIYNCSKKYVMFSVMEQVEKRKNSFVFLFLPSFSLSHSF